MRSAPDELTDEAPAVEKSDDDGLRAGVEAESEHQRVYDLLENYVRINKHMPPAEVLFALIARDHLDEDPDYYKKLADAGL